jgi:hypothetical protein
LETLLFIIELALELRICHERVRSTERFGFSFEASDLGCEGSYLRIPLETVPDTCNWVLYQGSQQATCQDGCPAE